MENESRQYRECSRSIQSVILVIIPTCLFAVLTIGAPDTALVGVEQAFSVPFVGVKTSFVTLLVILPMMLIGLNLYLHLLLGFSLTLGELEGEYKLPFIFNLPGRVPRWISACLFYWIVPLTLAGLTWKASPHKDSWALLIVTCTVAIAAIWLQTRRNRSTRRWLVHAIRWVVMVAAAVPIALVACLHAPTPTLDDEFVFRHPVSSWKLLVHRPLNLYGAKLSDQDLRSFSLVAATLKKADLTEAILNQEDLTDADLSGAHLRMADLNEANLRGADLSGADLTKAALWGADLGDATLIDAKLNQASLTRARMHKARLSKADLTGAWLNSTFLSKAYLDLANLDGANLGEADLNQAVLKSANLTKTDLTKAHLIAANLTGANLTGAKLSGANLTNADLTNADLTMTDLSRANLTGARVTSGQFSKACSDGDTIFPERVRPHEGMRSCSAAMRRLRGM